MPRVPITLTVEQLEAKNDLKEEADWKAKQERWYHKKGKVKPYIIFKVGSAFANSAGFPPITSTPGDITCSFCLAKISYFQATQGQMNRLIKQEEVVEDNKGNKQLEVKYLPRPVKVTACPDCVGKLQPTLDYKTGAIIHSGLNLTRVE